MEEKNKKAITISLSTFFLIIAIAVILVMGYFMIKANKENEKLKEEQNNSNEIIKYQTNKDIENNIPKIDKEEKAEKLENNKLSEYKPLYIEKSNKIKGNKSYDVDYRFNSIYNGIVIENVEKNSATLAISSRTFKSEDTPYNVEKKTIKTSKNIQEVYSAGIGQGLSDSYMFFLLEDGTIEYLNIYKAIVETKDFTVNKIAGIKDVVKFYQVDCYDEMSGGVTVLAQRNDGKFYDLKEYI